jgi:hypothetical protein
MINEKLIGKDLEGSGRELMEVWDLLGVPPSSAYFLLSFLFDSEDGANWFLRNVGLSSNYTGLQSRNPYSS